MTDQAIILIPDISGFTEFTSTTEIDHSAHIISELLALIVRSNESDFTLAEIEGDAVLFYRKGIPLNRKQLVGQCLNIFSNFHRQLKLIERDTVCQCGACQSATNLTLKFIAHFGHIKEIKVDRFVKATGVDMIVAHRLLKNNVDSDEYILMTEPCCDAVGQNGSHPMLNWVKSNYSYPSIGNVNYEFAGLSTYKASIPPPPVRQQFVVEKEEDILEVVIHAPLKKVYQCLIDIDKRAEWIQGVSSIERDMTSERIDMRHDCVFVDMTVTITTVFSDFKEDHARYSEEILLKESGIKIFAHYDLSAEDAGTKLIVNVNWMNAGLPAEMKQALKNDEISNLDQLKLICERNF